MDELIINLIEKFLRGDIDYVHLVHKSTGRLFRIIHKIDTPPRVNFAEVSGIKTETDSYFYKVFVPVEHLRELFIWEFTPLSIQVRDKVEFLQSGTTHYIGSIRRIDGIVYVKLNNIGTWVEYPEFFNTEKYRLR
tara:strand:+ start:6780 stop:7184 length:405 start_codon:yes stop_codon:yes gene_type:complete